MRATQWTVSRNTRSSASVIAVAIMFFNNLGCVGGDNACDDSTPCVDGLVCQSGMCVMPGPAGPAGEKGDKGDKGDPGIQGEKGETGATGETGAQGDPGSTGLTGATGAQGDKGETGATGETGAQGDPGKDGADGATGPAGPKGDTGPQGSAGMGCTGAVTHDNCVAFTCADGVTEVCLPTAMCASDADCPDQAICLGSKDETEGEITAVMEQYCSQGKCAFSDFIVGDFCAFGCSKGSCFSECTTNAQCGFGQTCSGGACVDTVCDDGNACTNQSKDMTGACVVISVISCDDGNLCTSDSCDPLAGCQYVGFTPADCDDGNVATTDSCNPANGCVHTPVQPTSCNDSLACTTDVLVNGQCTYTVHNEVCDDGNPATTDSCDQTKGCVNNPVGEHDVVVQCDVGFPCEVHLYAQPDFQKGYTGNNILDKSGTAPAVYGLSQAQISGDGLKIKIRWLVQDSSGNWIATMWSGDTGAASMLDHVKVWVDGVLKQAPGVGQPKLPLKAVPGETNAEGNWIVATNQFKP